MTAAARVRLSLVVVIVAMTCLTSGSAMATQPETSSAPEVSPVAVPILAYYYIWFDPSSWKRAKTDYPLLGRYSSDDTAVMKTHVAMAKSAGIDGFLVSWKDTSRLTPRLEKLVEIARSENFSLSIVYQGLDFEREPINVEKIRHDFELLADRYAFDPVFTTLGRPVVIWTGTKRFTREQIAYVTRPVAGRLAVLASAGDVDEYERVADLVSGNAHYWSSINPDKPWYPQRMQQMADAVHASHGLWVAPAAPGFDARLIGGTSVVPRRGTETLATGLSVAAQSQADAIGLISWNEFSENSHVEPSEQHGTTALGGVASFAGMDPDEVVGIDSSGAASGHAGLTGWAAILVTTTVLVGGVVAVRRGWQRSTGHQPATGWPA